MTDDLGEPFETMAMPLPLDLGRPPDPATDGVVLLMRSVPVLLDTRVAAAFGVETRAINQTVARGDSLAVDSLACVRPLAPL